MAMWVAGLMLCLAAEAQTGRVETVTGFRVPDYDAQNRLRSVLTGDFARIRPDGLIEITGLRIEFYSPEGQVTMTALSPQCVFDRNRQVAQSEDFIEIRREALRITGTGFRWDIRAEQLEIFRNARVEIEGVREKIASGGAP